MRFLPHTWLDIQDHAGFLNDRAYPVKGGKTAVVIVAIFQQCIREVQIPIETHGHPLILLNVSKIWEQYREEG